MIEVYGKYNQAICYTDLLAEDAYKQILNVCNDESFKETKIRIMPDVHSGKGCTIGTTMTIKDKVSPSMVGVDIGCGMETVCLGKVDIDFKKLDDCIRRNIPSGNSNRKTYHKYTDKIDITKLYCYDKIEGEKALFGLGTLGGGNHFIEIDKDEDDCKYLVIHSGSRRLGKEVAEYYVNQAYEMQRTFPKSLADKVTKDMLAQGKSKNEIADTIDKMKKDYANKPISKELCCLEGELFDMYIHDMKLVQQFATLNRQAIADTIINVLGLPQLERFTTIHNYIDTESMILRKGSVSAKNGEKLLIPINMRDGALICLGKGNENWNYSAPHGAGRLLKRSTAKETLTLEEYQKQMEGIYTTCICPGTLDESPMAYKDMDAIVSQITPSVEIVKVIKPIYNFKASGK